MIRDADGARPGPTGPDGPPALIGRAAEQELLTGALAQLPHTGAALVLRGAAGIGKTALLDWVVARGRAAGLRVLRMTGSETESPHAYAALHQIIWPLGAHLAALPAAQRTAVDQALGHTRGEALDPFLLSTGVLGLLERASAGTPLLLVLDDLHWADPSSARVLAFVQRRAVALPLVMVAAARLDGQRVDTEGARVLDLAPLDEDAALSVLLQRRPGLSGAGRRRVLDQSAGYPLALMELPAVGPEQFWTEELARGLPLAQRLERSFGEQLRRLAPSARQALLLAALTGVASRPALLTAAAAAAGTVLEESDLDEIRAGGLAVLDARTGTLTFRHPLVRASLINGTPPAELRHAHTALASVLPEGDERRATHLAAAAHAPDDAVAALLDRAAHSAVSRGGDAEAATLLARAAELSGDPDEHTRRLTEGATAAIRGGDLELADRLISMVDRSTLDPARDTAHAYSLAYIAMNLDADFGVAQRVLPRGLATLTAHAGEPWTEGPREPYLFHCLFTACYTGDRDLWELLAPELEDVTPAMRLCADLWRDPARTAHDGARRLAELIAAMPPEEETAYPWTLLWAVIAVDTFEDHEALWRRIEERSPYVTRCFIAFARTGDDFLRGRWTRALRLSQEGSRQARDYETPLYDYVFDVLGAYVHAGRGDADEVGATERRLAAWGTERIPLFVRHQLRTSRALCALGLGEYEDAWAQATTVTPAGELPATAPQFHLVFLTLIEAAMHTGRYAEARRHVAAGEAAGMASISPHHAFVLAAGRALATRGEEFGAACEVAYAVPGSEGWVFELARVRLAHGTWLRRGRDLGRARDLLLTAHGTFTELGARPWALRAAQELRALGHRTPDAAPTGGQRPGALTAQEERIATLASTGLTNKEIGVRLRMSPRTVGAHLYKLFPKLGVTNRTELARALAGTDRVPDAEHPGTD